METDNKSPVETPPEETPEVFAINQDNDGVKYNRRTFLELASVATAGTVLAAGTAGNEARAAAGCTVRTDKTDTPVHVGPGRNRSIRSYLKKDKDYPVLGKADAKDGSLWWKIEIAKVKEAWVADEDVTKTGDCGTVSAVGTPVIVTAAPRQTPTPTTAPQGAQPSAPPGQLGYTPAGQTGINYRASGQDYWLPCGSPIPAGAVCTCNCVSMPAPPPPRNCTCDRICTCDRVGGHYWYPN